MKYGIFRNIEEMVPTDHFKPGVHFEVVSYWVIDYEYDFHPANRYFGRDSYRALSTEEVEGYHTMNNLLSFSKTPFVEMEQNSYFYKLKGPISFDHALSLGFGVIQMLTGKWRGEYLLYRFNPLKEEPEDLALDFIDELLMLKVYIQLTYPEQDDKQLEKVLKRNKNYLSMLIYGDSKQILSQLESIYQSKKGKLLAFVK